MAFSDPAKNLTALGLKEGERVVDLGAGSGFYTLAAAKLVGGSGKVYAVEVQKDLLVRLKNDAHAHNLTNIDLVHGNMEELGGTHIKENMIDAALVCNVLFQVEDKDGFVNEIKRILKHGSRVLIIDWKESFGGIGPHSEAVFSEAQAAALFEKHSFKKVSSFDGGDHHYGLVYKRM